MKVSKVVFNILVLFKLSWYFMLFSVVFWNFVWILYTAKSMLGIDLIAGWSLVH